MNPEGIWMERFLEGVHRKGLRLDAIGVHAYEGCSTIALQRKLERVHSKCGLPIIITEFAVADWTARTPEENRFTADMVLQFMAEILPWLEEMPWILGYAWFPFDEDSPSGTSSALFRRDGSMTMLGEYYAKYNPNKSCERLFQGT
jgi:hypothetical protein